MTRVRRAAAMTVGVLLAGLVSACGVQLPTSGPVVEAQQPVLEKPVTGPYRDPAPPPQGANPVAIVNGFFDAMTAVPLQTTAASQFLTSAGRQRWQPQDGVVVYGQPPTPHGEAVVRARLRGAHWVSRRGIWRGRLSPAQSQIELPMKLDKREWRINRAPNALLVPASWYQQNFRTASIYFFDPTGRILVPEPVHVPSGAQLATWLVRSLLLGPVPSLTGVVHSFIPPGLTSQSVLVHNGVADVTLKGTDPGSLDQKTTRLLLAQFSWTLAQVPSVHAFRLTIGGERITSGAADATYPVANPDSVDPTDSLASGLIYALRNGRLVSGQAKAPSPVNGPFGRADEQVSSFAVSLDGTQVAGVTPEGLTVGPVQGGGSVTTVYRGTHLLRPSWDFAGRLWEVDLTPQGASVVVYADHTAQTVHVPGVSGEHVSKFVVSRDGSRFVAVIHGRHGDRIVVSRIRYSARRGVVGAGRARALPWRAGGSGPVSRIRDLGWLSPTTIGVLHLLTRDISEVQVILVDGSTQPGQASTISIPGRARGLAASPVGTDTSYAILKNTLTDLSGSSPDVSFHGLRGITYAG
jgi:hypothetical protein